MKAVRRWVAGILASGRQQALEAGVVVAVAVPTDTTRTGEHS